MMQENLLSFEEEEESAETVVRKPLSPLLKLASPPEARSQRDSELIGRLQKEIAALQMELEKAKQEILRYEMLLRNAKQRELELRAEMRPRQK
jgi:hypothetical protein